MTLGLSANSTLAVGTRPPVVAGRRRGSGFRDWSYYYPRALRESLPARAAATGTLRADKPAAARVGSWC